jgi:hypothetical protein
VSVQNVALFSWCNVEATEIRRQQGYEKTENQCSYTNFQVKVLKITATGQFMLNFIV